MTTREFNARCASQINRCLSLLDVKKDEYGMSGDRLHNFRAASQLTGRAMPEVLAMFMLKHIVSIYDMCLSCDILEISEDMWKEKIGDAINYLLLLSAMVIKPDLPQYVEEKEEN